MPDLPKDATPGDGDPAEPTELSRLLLSQIQERMKEMLASERVPKYCVIRSQVSGVLSILASSTLGHDHHIVWGPRSFAACVGYVSSAMVARQADGGTNAPPNPEVKS